MYEKSETINAITIGISIALATTMFNLLGQCMVYNKLEISSVKIQENSLIQSLIPYLLSSNPKELDIALSILEETSSKSKYESIKSIVDKKIENDIVNQIDAKATEVATRFKSLPKEAVISDKLESVDLIVNIAQTRNDWKNIALSSLDTQISKVSRNEFLDKLNYINVPSLDETLKKIIEASAKALNSGDYLLAYACADWVTRAINNGRPDLSFLGIYKSAPAEQQDRILRYYIEDLYDQQIRYFHLSIITNVFKDFGKNGNKIPRSEGENRDAYNRLFLEKIAKKNPFENLLNPRGRPEQYKKLDW